MDGATSISRSLSPQDSEMRDQLHVLQEREMLLTQKLALEREKRMHAERVTETQRQACMELHLLLDKERRLSGRYSKAPEPKAVRKTKLHNTSDESENGVNGSSHVLGKEERDSDSEQMAVGNGVSSGSGGTEGESEIPLLSLTARVSLTDEVFSNLPEDLQELLLSSSSSSKLIKPTGTQALFDAATCGDAASLETLLKMIGLVDSVKTQNNSTLTHIVAARGYQDCLQVLLEAGADPNSIGPALTTPVILAAAEGHHKCLRLLTAAGGYSTHRDAEGCDALYRAALGGHDKCIQVLLDGGMESFGVNNAGQTAVHAAVQSQSTSCLRILLTHLRAHHSESTVARLLCSQDHNGQSVVHYAAGSGVKACLEILLPSPELDLELRDRWNRTALDLATPDCRELLISRDFREVLLAVSTNNNHKDSGSEEEGEGGHVIGKVYVLRHHKWSDLDLLVEDSLACYCSMLKGHLRSRGGGVVRPGAGEGELGSDGKEDEVVRKGQSGRKQALDVLDDFCDGVAGLSLSPHPIQSYRVGQVTWKWGEAPRGGQPRGPFMLFAPKEGEPFDARPELVVTLSGVAQESVDDIALSTLYSSGLLLSYVDLVQKHKNVIIHGPSGSGKTFLAKQLAECLKSRQELTKPEVVHAVMHPGFKREDLLRLLHFTGALVRGPAPPAEREGETAVLTGEEEGASVPPSPSAIMSPRPSVTSIHSTPHSVIIILDDVNRISLSEVLGELAGLLDKRGPQHAVWVGPTHGRGGAEESHPPACFYLKEDVFFIATMNKKSGSDLDQFSHDRFKHIWLSPNKEPTAGLLLRHLMHKAIHTNRGRLPAKSSQFYRTIQWVYDVWCLLNHYLTRMGLVEAYIGPRHFFSCPVEEGSPEAIIRWMVELWNTQLVPLIRDVCVYSHPTGSVERVDICAQVLTTLTQRAFRPTSPLDPRATLKLLVQLDGGEEGLAMIAEARRKAKGGKSPVMSCVDLKDDRSFPIPRTCSAGSLPIHSIGSTPLQTPQGTPAVPRRETFAGTSPKSPHKSSLSSSAPEADTATGKKTNSLPTDTPPSTKKEFKNVSTPEKEKKKKKKSTGRMFAKKKSEEEERLRASSPNLTMDGGGEQLSHGAVKKKPDDLDDIVDLVFSLTADRLNEQRSPLPPARNRAQPAFGLYVSPLAQSTAATVEQPPSLQSSSTDTSVYSMNEGGGETSGTTRNCSTNVNTNNNNSSRPRPPPPVGLFEGEEQDGIVGIHRKETVNL